VDIGEPIVGQYASAFHFHATLAGVLGPALVREQVVEVCQPSQQRLLAATGMSNTRRNGQSRCDVFVTSCHPEL
jgi:hypothetical protein